MPKGYIDEIKTAENYIADILPFVEMIIRAVDNWDGGDISHIKDYAQSIETLISDCLE